MSNNLKKIDLLTEWQNKTFVALGEVYFRERNNDGKLVFELLLATIPFNEIIEHIPYNENLKSSGFINKYRQKRYVELEDWAEDSEEECEELLDFYNQLKSIKKYIKREYENEYNAIIEICESSLENKNKLFFMADNN